MDVQEIRNQLSNELEILEQNLEEIRPKKESAQNLYRESTLEIRKIENILQDLAEQQEKLPYKNHEKIEWLTDLTSLFITLAIIFMTSIMIVPLVFPIETLIIRMFIGMGLIMLDWGLIAITSVKLTKKIKRKLKEKSYDKIIASDEYQKILEKIKAKETELSEERDLADCRYMDMKNYITRYDTYLEHISDRKSFIRYIDQSLRTEQYDKEKEARGRVRKLEQ